MTEERTNRLSLAGKGAAWGALLGLAAALVNRHLRFALDAVATFAGAGAVLGAIAGLLFGDVFFDRAREWWEEWPPRH